MTGDEYYHGFLGVPIIHHRKLLGVLVVRQRERRKFAEDEVAFLVTMAAQLAGAIAHAEASGGIGRYGEHDGARRDDGIIDGLAGAPGVGIGVGMVIYPPADLNAVPDRTVTDVDAEIIALKTAVAAVQSEIQILGERLSAHISIEEQALFDAYALMLSSESLVEKVVSRIRAGNWASGALRETINEHARVIEDMNEPYLRERADDIRDLGRRILVRLQSTGQQLRLFVGETGVFITHGVGRVGIDPAAIAVDDERAPFHAADRQIASAHHRRYAHGARQDGEVRRTRTACRHHAHQAFARHFGQHGGGDLFANQYGARWIRRRFTPAGALQTH